MFQVYRGDEEFYIVCKDKYMFWNYVSLCWNSSMYSTWEERAKTREHSFYPIVINESNWLELLVVTGQTEDQAMDAWGKFSKGELR